MKGWKKYWHIIVRTFQITLIAFLVSTITMALIYKWCPVYYTPLMFIRAAEQIGDSDFKMKHRWIPLDQMSRHLPKAVIAAEDAHFMEHCGFDFDAIQKAFEDNRKGRKKARGGSTISQQTAKNVFLWPTSSWARKGLEVYFTALIELTWSKERIMEVYLNSIEMGKGIYGAESVANENFNTTAKELSRRQCALIAASLPAPRKYNSAKPGPYLIKRSGQILRGMKFVDDFKMTSSNDEKK